MTSERLIEGWSEQTAGAVTGRHVLAIQDTSEIGFNTTAERTRGLGEIGKGRSRGALLHAMLAVDAQHGACLGLVGGEIWTRPGLPRHTRSLLTLVMMIALNRSDEFKMHVKAAANNGVTVDEIKEVILQAAIYCGVPAANSAFHQAQEALRESGALPPAEPG